VDVALSLPLPIAALVNRRETSRTVDAMISALSRFPDKQTRTRSGCPADNYLSPRHTKPSRIHVQTGRPRRRQRPWAAREKDPGSAFGPEPVPSATGSVSVVYWVPGPFPRPTPVQRANPVLDWAATYR